MRNKYSKEQQIEILTYARDHGTVAAAQKYKISHQLIGRWNKQLNIYKPQTAEYPIEQRRQVLEYARDNSIREAAKKFGVSVATIKNWNGQMRIFAPKRVTFTEAQKIEILEYARDVGPRRAADKFGIDTGTICRWNRRHKVYSPLKEYTKDEIIKMLTYVRDNGLTAASEEFDIPKFTLIRWNKTYKIYVSNGPADYVPFTPEQQQEILNAALAIYKTLPADSRSARQAFMYTTEKYPVTIDQLGVWNRKFRIVPVRPLRRRQITQAEIDAVQSALDTSRGRVAAASRKTGISTMRINKLKKDKKVTFDKGTRAIETNPPVGRRKAKLIGAIIGGLLNNKGRE